MKRVILTVNLLILFNLNGISQNLVLNSDFESYKVCPVNIGYLNNLYNWYNPTNNSPDFFSSCFDSLYSFLGAGVPKNLLGYQIPHSGYAYCGIGLYVDGDIINNNLREYIAGFLSDTLKKDSIYCTEFFASPKYFSRVTSSVGIYFSKQPIYDTLWGNWDTINKIPQVENDTDNYLIDTLNWIRLAKTFIAEGGEKYLTIGNFSTNIKSHIKPSADTSVNNSFIYIFIDDVAVYKGVCKNEEEVKKEFFKLYPNPSSGNFYLNYGIKENAAVKIYDILGREIYSADLDPKQTMFNILLPNASAGMYFLRVLNSSNKKIYDTKFLKQ